MAFDVKNFASLRPFLFHLTARTNLEGIRSTGILESANSHFRRAGVGHQSTQRRLGHVLLHGGSGPVVVRDQVPLQAGHIDFESGWSLAKFVGHVNEHVFFWPGSVHGPVRSGLSHYARYASEQVAILRIPTVSLGPGLVDAAFSRFNSGAPRSVGGRRSPRGGETYVDAVRFRGTVQDVVEVVFRDRLRLPTSAEWATSYQGPWRLLFEAAA